MKGQLATQGEPPLLDRRRGLRAAVRANSFDPHAGAGAVARGGAPPRAPLAQGLTLVHFLAQRKHFLCDRGSIQGVFRRFYGALGDLQGVFCIRNGSG